MENIWILIFVISAFLGGIVLPFFFLRIFKSKLNQSFDLLIDVNSDRSCFSTEHFKGIGPGLIYCPHPYTNWSLNPGYLNSKNQIEHTQEGFRKTDSSNSILEIIEHEYSTKKIVCVGGSSTYCTELDDYKMSWPAKLKEKLGKNNFSVFNFGVGGWGTISSLIRCITWLPLIKPDIVVFYQAKNDLTPLMNGDQLESACFPDYQNLIVQLSQEMKPKLNRFFYLIPILKLFAIKNMPKGLSCVYSNFTPNKNGLNRLDQTLRKGYIFRVEILARICSHLGSKMLFIPEIVKRSPYRQPLLDLYTDVNKSLKKYENVQIFEPDNLISDEYLLDKMHFNEAGCELFSSLISVQIKKMI